MPISIVALICIGFVVAANVMQNSWWNDRDRPPSADQQASDGMSLFTGAGVDYFTREGIMRVRVGSDAPTATELGLPADGEASFEPLTPVQVIVLAPDGAFHIDLVRSFTVTTEHDHVESVELEPEANGSWLAVLPHLERMSTSWGWTSESLDQLQTDLTAASHSADAEDYSAQLTPVEHKGALVSAEVGVSVQNAGVIATVSVARLDR